MKKMTLTTKVLIAMVLGILVGLAINILHLNQPDSFIDEYIVNGLFAVVGKLFIQALKMLVVPLVLFSLISGVVGIGDIKALGRVGVKSFMLYLFTTAVAIALGISIAASVGVGEGMKLESSAIFKAKEAPPISEVLINIIPSNIIKAMSDGQMLSIIFFAVMFGIAMLMVGRKSKPLVEIIELLNEVMMQMVNIVMFFAPFAVFALMAKAISELGLDMLTSLAGYVLVLLLTLAIHLFGTLMGLLRVLGGVSPKIFLQKFRDAQTFAFSTSSSNATIPVTLRSITQRMGVDNSVASFTIPFGATINMDGTAIMQGVATVFVANVYGVDLGISGYLTVIVMSLLASIGTAGVPGVGLIMLSMVFTQVGLPVEGIGLILGVDRVLDMARTVINVTGDGVVSLIVAKSEKKFSKETFDDPDAGMYEEIDIDEKVEEELAEVIKEERESL